MKHFKGITVSVRCQYEKILRIMKITALLLFAAIIQSNANGFSQSTFTINKSVASVKKVIKEIENQSEYSVFYRQDQLDVNKKISIAVKNVSIDSLMKEVLAGQSLTFKVIGKVIVIKPSNENADAVNEITVSGTVYSATGNKPIPGITVSEKNTTNVTITDANGRYTIRVKSSSSVLVFHAVNFKQAEVTVGDQKVINVTLEEEVKVLDQVVVVGYGSQKKKDLTGAVAVIGSKELEDRPNTQFGYSIEGKAAGVQVIRSSGQPQAGFSIRVRGTSSITSGSDPLYIVDGVPTSNTNEINPADIESISVLKDASSAAIYGSAGANGVVLITTKRGKNQKLKISFNTSLNISQAWKKMDVLNGIQFKQLMTDMSLSTDWNKYNANTDWQKEIFRNALTQNYQLSATGGNAKTTYYISGSTIKQNGIVLNNNVNRSTLKINLDHSVTKFLKIGATLSYDNWKDRDVPENDRNGVITRLFTAAPITGIRDMDNPQMYARSPFINDLENPVSTVYQPDHLFKNNRYHGNIYAEAEVLKGLKLKSLFGYEKSNGVYTSFQDSVQTRYGKSLSGIASENTYNYKYWVSENTISYTTKIKDHNIAALVGFIASRGTTDNLYKSSHDFSTAVGGSQSVDAGAVQSIPSPFFTQQSHVSVIARLNYNYKDKYFITSNLRRDAFGQFSAEHRWGTFPSFSAGWRISNEDFFKSVKGVNELKLRAGWGIVGNDRAQDYSRFGLVDSISNKYLINGVNHTAFTPTSLENIDLKWEKTSQVDIGLDLTILNSRLSFTADYYYKKTTDMLLAVPIPTSTGFSVAWQNAGSLENKGFEFQISSKNIVRSDFKWNTDFNISFNRNKVLNIVGNTLSVGAINPAGDDFYTALVQEGKPLGSFYGKISKGVDVSTGNINFMKKADGSADSVGIIGNANPKYTFGLTNSFTYKNFTLNIFIQGVQGNQILNATRVLTESMSLAMNQNASVLRRWTKSGDITDVPKVTPNDWSNSNPSTRYLEDGSYVRLKSLTLGYNLPQSALAKLKMSRCMIYFTGENLLTFTKYTGFDPEVSAFSGSRNSKTNQNTAPGVDYGTYPQSRDFILGVNISF